MKVSKNKQKAIDQLKRAFKACDKAGLVFADMEGDLVALERKELKRNQKRVIKKGPWEWQAFKDTEKLSIEIDNWEGGWSG